MRFSEQWLRSLVDLEQIDREELLHRLTMAGLEVDVVHPVAGDFAGVVVARIVEAGPHPDADKLKVCQVDDGSGELLQIVCGAPNARPGLVAPLARVGATLPGDFKIRKAKLRGVASHGMLCSAKELGLSEDAAGLYELPEALAAGDDLRAALDLDDVAIEVDLTPNRADCLGMIGLAQEVAAIFGRELCLPDIPEVAPVVETARPIELVAPADCARYVGRAVDGIDVSAETPLWMAERLRRAGLRPISPTVDVTNYVMLELGQPMHAFDLDRLQGGISVRRATGQEPLTLLTEEKVVLDERFLMIADEAGSVAIGGVMGGLDSSVTDETTRIFFESAWFQPAVIVGKARELGMHTDASHRFERGVDPQGQRRAIERATELLVQIAGGSPGPVCEAVSPDHLPDRPVIRLRRHRIERLLGTPIADDAVEDILAHLGMAVSAVDEGWDVQAPSRRFDMAIEEDLIEELARIYGYDRLVVRAPEGAIPAVVMPERRFDLDRVRQVLVDRGFVEAVNYSFIAPEKLEPIDGEALPLANPLSADLAVMRTSLLPGLLDNLAFNQRRQQQRVRLFELGTTFPMSEGEVVEHPSLAGIVAGAAAPEQWGVASREVDFFDLKGDLEAALALTGTDDYHFEPAAHPWLHPGQAADVYRGERRIGWVGALHPHWVERAEARGRIYGFEIDLGALGDARLPVARTLSRYPSIRRDLALIVPREVPWRQIRQVVQETGGNLLTELVVFDEYTGSGIDEGEKSVALGLVLQDEARTLTDDEVDAIVENITRGLAETLDARLRA